MTDIVEAPWYDAFPKPVIEPATITKKEVLQRIINDESQGKSVILVDVRRTDFEGGTIKGSINLPAQSFYQTKEAFYNIVNNSPISEVIFFCSKS
ncbi:hypothetical protein V1514DRAFT_34847, partial [Lipomyces japonicus]|uniref:uncharacterized protein n=1 Tax=Lipomyces japonicus TaxID=56871 RepID=UPI0034CFD60D